MTEYTSLFSSEIDVGGFIAQAPKLLAHPYMSCLILLTLLAYCRVCGKNTLLGPVLEAPCILGIDCLRIVYLKDQKGAFGVVTMNTEKIKLACLASQKGPLSWTYCVLMN